MRILCPRCHHACTRKTVREGTGVTCTVCGAVSVYRGRGQGWEWTFPSEPESREASVTWSRSSYLDAKIAAIRRQTPRGRRFAVCPVCGRSAVAGHCHHVWLSQRYAVAKHDLRNIIIVCNPTYANCHSLAQGEAKEKVEEALCKLLGEGNVELGQDIVREARTEWSKN